MNRSVPMLLALGLALSATPVAAVTCQGAFPAANPDSVYTDNGDDTVTDVRTGLTWTRCAEGQAWSGAACTGSASFIAWAAALELAEASTFASHDDWRVPNIKELLSLVETCRRDPSINDTVFPNTSFATAENFSWWSSSPVVTSTGTPDKTWFVRTGRGDTGNGGRTETKMVRLVRSAD